MICSKCNDKDNKNFYKSKINRNYNLCKTCTKDCLCERRNYLKLKAVEYKGGKCSICGYNKNNGALDFHHKGKKEHSISRMISHLNKWESIKKELDKCDLLCSNCHREIHCNHIEEKDFKFKHSLNGRNGTDRTNRKRVKKLKLICPTCKNEFTRKPRKNRKHIFCSRLCKDKSQRKVNLQGVDADC